MSVIKFCRFQRGDAVSYGIVEDDTVRGVNGDPFRGYTLRDDRHPLRDVRLLVPIVPGTFYAIGSNYRDHVIGRSSTTSPASVTAPTVPSLRTVPTSSNRRMPGQSSNMRASL